jgi:O-antigen ligase
LPLPAILILVMGTALGLLMLIHPIVGLLLLPFAVPFGSLRELPLGSYGIGTTEVLIGLTLAAWLAQGIAHRQIRLELPPLSVPLLLLLGAMLLSAPNARALGPTIKELVKWGEILLVYVLTFNLLGNQKAIALRVRTLNVLTRNAQTIQLLIAYCLLLAVTLEALHGIAGAVLRIGPPQFAILGGRLYRAAGVFQQPNPFGGYMNHGLPIALSLLVGWLLLLETRPQARTRRSLLLGIALALVAGVLSLGLVLSWSRGAWLGAVAGLTAVGLGWLLTLLLDRARDPFAQRARRWAMVVAWLGITAGLLFLAAGGFNLLPATVTARLASGLATFTTLDVRGAVITDANFATLERIAHWQAAVDMWRDHFWTGVGIGNYVAAYADYGLPKWPYALGHAHNIYLNLAAEAGFIGLVAYLLFVGAALWHTWRVAGRVGDPLKRGIAIGVLGMLVALGVHNLFDNMYVHAMGVHVALALGLVSALGMTADPPRADRCNRGTVPVTSMADKVPHQMEASARWGTQETGRSG